MFLGLKVNNLLELVAKVRRTFLKLGCVWMIGKPLNCVVYRFPCFVKGQLTKAILNRGRNPGEIIAVVLRKIVRKRTLSIKNTLDNVDSLKRTKQIAVLFDSRTFRVRMCSTQFADSGASEKMYNVSSVTEKQGVSLILQLTSTQGSPTLN